MKLAIRIWFMALVFTFSWGGCAASKNQKLNAANSALPPEFEKQRVALVAARRRDPEHIHRETAQRELLSRHVIHVDQRGKLIPPHENACNEQCPLPEVYFDNLINAILTQPKALNGRRQVLFFVHGGLNTMESSMERALQLTMTRTNVPTWPDSLDGKPDELERWRQKSVDLNCQYYPVFLNWKSGLGTSYWEHLTDVRQGMHQENGTRNAWWLATPFYFAADLGRGAAGFPLAIGQQFQSDYQASLSRWLFTPDYEKQAQARSYVLRQDYQQGAVCGVAPKIAVSMGTDRRSASDFVLSATKYWLFLPTRLFSTLVVGSAGQPAWENMSRRTQMIIHNTDEYKHRNGSTTAESLQQFRSGETGAGGLFFKRLAERLKADASETELTLVGHSMGTMVLNEALLEHGWRFDGKARIKSIVYLAGACQIRDWQRAVFPYLRAESGCQFYSLSLHPTAERLEGNVWDMVARGSLLQWVDNFLANPETVEARTIGQWDNSMMTAHDIPENLRGRIHFKAFGQAGAEQDVGKFYTTSRAIKEFPATDAAIYRKTVENYAEIFRGQPNPQTHSSFGDEYFWKPVFWMPKPR